MDRTFNLFSREDESGLRIVTGADVTASERKSLPYLVLAVLPYNAQPNGLPTGHELDRVAKIEDRIVEALGAKGGLYLGHITGGGSLTVALHAPSEIRGPITVKTGLLSKRVIPLECSLDAGWSYYDQHMAATPLEQEISRNRKLLATLRQHGDDPS